MNFKDIRFPVYGDITFRGDCPVEEIEQATFFNWVRQNYPNSYGLIALHPRNEQQLRGGQYTALVKQKAEGMTKGAADIIIPGAPTFVCEMKRRDHTKSRWEKDQINYLSAAYDAGCFVCVALGWEAAHKAFMDWTC